MPQKENAEACGSTLYRVGDTFNPLGRLDTISAAGLTTKLQYDGINISAELDGAMR